jgi:hypothetical protein
LEAANDDYPAQENKYLKELILSNNQFVESAGSILGPAIGE